MEKIRRVFLIVIDSMGCGFAPDADRFGDTGACTLNSIQKSGEFHIPNMERLGLMNITGFRRGQRYYYSPYCDCGVLDDMDAATPKFEGVYGRLTERSRGKDTTAGHWEIAGLVTDYSFPTFPEGFPQEVLEAFAQRTGRGVLCNRPYSGTDVIRDYGEEHLKTGKLIVYTSADSVFQIAANESIVPPEELYRYCRIARELLTGDKLGVGRVIARPFVGTDPANFVRINAHRHDFSILPPKDTALDLLQKAGFASIGVGKIRDIFAGKGLDEALTTASVSNVDGMEKTIALLDEDFEGLCFVNLVETDSVFGHRRDVDGYAKAVSTFDAQLGTFLAKMHPDDVVMITADHGCDPGFTGTDHTREYIPFVAYGSALKADVDLGTRGCFGDIGATILDLFGVDASSIDGTSFRDLIIRDKH